MINAYIIKIPLLNACTTNDHPLIWSQNFAMYTEENRACFWCDTPLRGRSDKKFCSVNCRNAYNNQQEHSVAHLIKITNYILRKNRNILAELYQQTTTETIVPREILLYKGFQFKYHTELLKRKNLAPIFILYDFGYQVINKDQIRILPFSNDLLRSWYSPGRPGRGNGM